MKIETTKFKHALDVVKPGLAAKEIIEQTTSFAFIDGQVVTYNDEISITHPLQASELQGVIKAEELYKFLAKVKEKEFDVNVTDNEVVMKAGRAKVGFALNTQVLLPLNDTVATKGKFKALPSEFLKALAFTCESASTDIADPKLTCVHFTPDGVLESTNNFRLVVWNIGEALPLPETLIPAASLKQVLKLKPTHAATGQGWTHFKNAEGTIISCRVFEETFVDTQSIVNGIGKGKKIKFPDGLVPILDKAEVFTQEQKTDGSVTLDFKGGKILVKSESTTAWFKESIAYDGDEQFSFSITPYLLKDILKQTNVCFFNKQVLKFKGEQWVYITSLRTFNE